MAGIRWTAVTVAALLAAGCGARPEALAIVGATAVSVDGFQLYLEAAAGQPWEAVDHRVATRLFDQYLDQEVVLEVAASQDGHSRPDDPAARTAAVRPLLRKLCGNGFEPAIPALEREVGRRLEEIRPRRARVRQLLLSELEAAVVARERVVAGEPFEAVSADVSRAPNAASGGDLGLISEGTLPPEIDDVVFALEAGHVSQPVRSPAGYHVFQVLEVVPAGHPPRAEVETAVRLEMIQRRVGERTRECLGDLASEVGVRVYADHLWFEYDGRYDGDEDADS